MPSGQRLDDGFSSTISFSLDTNIALWEIEVKPPGVDGGSPVETDTMRNTTWRTRNPKQLKTMTGMELTVGYDPQALSSIVSMINVNQVITLTWPDGSAWKFWGYLRSWEPGNLKEGERPTAKVMIEPTNQNNSHTEVGPTVTTRTSTTTTTTTTTP